MLKNHEIIQDLIEEKISDEEFKNYKKTCTHNTPELKESMYYRQIFDKYYPNHANTIPHFWLPKWSGNVIDPSARVLSVYNN